MLTDILNVKDVNKTIDQFPYDLLALIVELRQSNVSIKQCYTQIEKEFLLIASSQNNISGKLSNPSLESIELANKIRRHYRNLLTLRKLKTGKLSQYRTQLFDYLNSPNKISESDLAILVKLFDFYNEDMYNNKLVHKYNTVDQNDYFTLNESIELIEIRPDTRSCNIDILLYKTQQNNILQFRTNKALHETVSSGLWKLLAKQKRIHFDGEVASKKMLNHSFHMLVPIIVNNIDF